MSTPFRDFPGIGIGVDMIRLLDKKVLDTFIDLEKTYNRVDCDEMCDVYMV